MIVTLLFSLWNFQVMLKFSDSTTSFIFQCLISKKATSHVLPTSFQWFLWNRYSTNYHRGITIKYMEIFGKLALKCIISRDLKSSMRLDVQNPLPLISGMRYHYDSKWKFYYSWTKCLRTTMKFWTQLTSEMLAANFIETQGFDDLTFDHTNVQLMLIFTVINKVWTKSESH